jgi:hypothetical protein
MINRAASRIVLLAYIQALLEGEGYPKKETSSGWEGGGRPSDSPSSGISSKRKKEEI